MLGSQVNEHFMWKYLLIKILNITENIRSKPHYCNIVCHVQFFFFCREGLGNGGLISGVTTGSVGIRNNMQTISSLLQPIIWVCLREYILHMNVICMLQREKGEN
uniref:Macaca fascicularis brain cDNA clone: QflA-21787, similar to human adenomatosis polyposis coli (APC), mRNA, RefSeq: NM_000038.2 n=1 Tax=Macaca fascicularis TaxID=9541 RepID=I7GME8_MACFA|nr:unnamed protein product [Macaca fascicularis]